MIELKKKKRRLSNYIIRGSVSQSTHNRKEEIKLHGKIEASLPTPPPAYTLLVIDNSLPIANSHN